MAQRRLESTERITCPNSFSSCDCWRCCSSMQCLCAAVKNSSSCCTSDDSYECTYNEDEDEGGFTMGSILRQIWFVFIAMAVISAIMWRRPAAAPSLPHTNLGSPFPPPRGGHSSHPTSAGGCATGCCWRINTRQPSPAESVGVVAAAPRDPPACSWRRDALCTREEGALSSVHSLSHPGAERSCGPPQRQALPPALQGTPHQPLRHP